MLAFDSCIKSVSVHALRLIRRSKADSSASFIFMDGLKLEFQLKEKE